MEWIDYGKTIIIPYAHTDAVQLFPLKIVKTNRTHTKSGFILYKATILQFGFSGFGNLPISLKLTNAGTCIFECIYHVHMCLFVWQINFYCLLIRFEFFFADEGELNCGPDSVDQLPSCLNYNARNLWDIFQPQIRIDTHTRYDGWCVSTNQNGNPIKRYPFRYRAKKVYCTGVLYAIPIFRASANGSYRACPMRWDYGPFSTPNTHIEWI